MDEADKDVTNTVIETGCHHVHLKSSTAKFDHMKLAMQKENTDIITIVNLV